MLTTISPFPRIFWSLIFWFLFLLVPDQPAAPSSHCVVILFFQLPCCGLVSRWGTISPITINKPSFVTASGTLGLASRGEPPLKFLVVLVPFSLANS